MKRVPIVALCACIALGAHAESPADFAYRLPLATDGGGAFFRIDIPAVVHEGAARGDLGDVRVFNAAGAAVAFAWLPHAASHRESAPSVELPVFPLRVEATRRELGDLSIAVRRDGGGVRVDLATRDGTPVAAERLAGYLVDASDLGEPLVALTLPLQGGAGIDTRVRVEASDDLAAWRTLAAGTPLIDLEYGGRRLTRDRIDLPAARAKFLRLTFDAGRPVPEIAALRGEFADRVVDAPRQWREVEGSAGSEGRGDFVYDLGGAFPVDRIALAWPEDNTIAPAQVFARATPKDEWRAVGATVFYRLRQDGADLTSAPLAIAPAPQRHFRVRVDPRSGVRGDRAPKLAAGWSAPALVFAARGAPPFELAFGSVKAQPAALPAATLIPGYDRNTSASFAVATVGAATLPPALAALRQPVDVKRWLLWGALGLATLVLAWMAYALARQLRAAPAQLRDVAQAPKSDPGAERQR